MNPVNEYINFLSGIKHRLQHAQIKTVMAANQQMIWQYWQLGNDILKHQTEEGWGAKIIDKLSADLSKEFPQLKGFSIRNLKYMKKFAETYTPNFLSKILVLQRNFPLQNEFVQQVVALLQMPDNESTEFVQQTVAQINEEEFLKTPLAQLSWSHNLILLDKLDNNYQRFWYMLNTLEHGISRNILAIQIESGLFERQATQKKISNFKNTLPPAESDFATYMLKDPYIFDFVQAKEKADERNIENQLVTHITNFLLELGKGFAFVGKQVHLEVGDQDFYIDLLFYHLKLRSYVVIELKARDFEPSDMGQLNFYLNVVNDKIKTEHDNNTIGLILCKGKNAVLAEYALQGYNQPMGIADYQLSKAIPDDIKSTLPSIEDIENELKELE